MILAWQESHARLATLTFLTTFLLWSPPSATPWWVAVSPSTEIFVAAVVVMKMMLVVEAVVVVYMAVVPFYGVTNMDMGIIPSTVRTTMSPRSSRRNGAFPITGGGTIGSGIVIAASRKITMGQARTVKTTRTVAFAMASRAIVSSPKRTTRRPLDARIFA